MHLVGAHEKGNSFQNEFPFVIQQGSCITLAYNRVGVESVLSLSSHSIQKECVHIVTIL
jgi:hypothetical protein